MGATTRLLDQWYAGDKQALQSLLDLHSTWVVGQARRLLGPNLRTKLELGDIVQEACFRFLKYPPQFRLANEPHFRNFLLQQIKNAITERHEWFRAQRRVPHGLIELLAVQANRVGERPSSKLRTLERHELFQAALRAVSEYDQRLIRYCIDEASYETVARELKVSFEAARKRIARAMKRLAQVAKRLDRESFGKRQRGPNEASAQE